MPGSSGSAQRDGRDCTGASSCSRTFHPLRWCALCVTFAAPSHPPCPNMPLSPSCHVIDLAEAFGGEIGGAGRHDSLMDLGKLVSRKKDFVPFTTTAHELRRLIAEAKGANESFIIKYTVRAAVRRLLLAAASR